MKGDDLPLSGALHACLCKTPVVVHGFAVDRARALESARDDGGVAVHSDAHVRRLVPVECHPSGAEDANGFSLRHQPHARYGHHQIVCAQPVHCIGIASEVGFVPDALEAPHLCCIWPVCLCCGSCLHERRCRQPECDEVLMGHTVSSPFEVARPRRAPRPAPLKRVF